MPGDEVVEREGHVGVARVGQGHDAAALVRRAPDRDDVGGEGLRDGLGRYGEVALGKLRRVPERRVQLGRSGVQALRALGAHGSEGRRELDREVLGHRVEQAGVVAPRGARLGPTHLHDGDDVAAKPDGHAHEAREGRRLAGRDAARDPGVVVDELAV